MKAFTRLLLVVPFMALVIAGCGGGSNGDSTSVEPVKATGLTKEELIRQGNAVCSKTNIAVASTGSTSSGVSEEVIELAKIYLGMVEQLKALGPPSDKSGGYSQFIASTEALGRGEKNLKLAYEHEDNKKVTAAIAQVSAAVTRFRSSTSDFGFIRCTVPPAPVR